MAPTLTISLFPAQIAAVASYFLANPEVAHAYGLTPVQAGALLMDSPEYRTYHLGEKPNEGRGYDDRLTKRLGPSRSKLMEEIALWEDFGGQRGGLRHTRGGNKIWVSEQACREWLGDNPAPGKLNKT